MSDCHPDCTIGPNSDHPGSSSYRCQDKNGTSLPFPGEKFTASDLGHGYVIYTFDRDHEDHADDGYWCNYCETMTEHMSSGHRPPKPRMVDPNTLALNIMAAKIARIRDEIAGWREDDSENSAAWSLGADLIEQILDGHEEA